MAIDWKKYFETARKLKRLKAWDFFVDSDVFAVEHPETGKTFYVSLCGQEGEYKSLVIYPKIEDFLRVFKAASHDDPDLGEFFMAQAVCSTEQYQLCFEEKDLLEEEALAVLKESGCRFTGDYPVFNHHKPASWPVLIDDEQVLGLYEIVAEVLPILLKNYKGTSISQYLEEAKVLSFQYKDEAWKPAVLALETPAKAMKPLIVDPETMSSLKALPKDKRGHFYFNHALMMAPSEENDQVIRQTVCALMDTGSSQLVAYDMVSPFPSYDAVCLEFPEVLAELLVESGSLPAKLSVSDEALFAQVSMMLNGLAKVSLVPVREEFIALWNDMNLSQSPESEDQVSAVVEYCMQHGIADPANMSEQEFTKMLVALGDRFPSLD